ncbi:MAG: ABC transporter permease [Chitinophagaceae bacterium]
MEIDAKMGTQPENSMSNTNLEQPPQWPLRILRLFINREYIEEIEGDMEEVFHDNCQRFTCKKAKRKYAWDTLSLLRTSLFRKRNDIHFSNQYAMFKNYLTVGVRHIVRHKFFSAINIICLALGITFSLIIGVYVLNEYSINASLKNVNNQYIVKSNWKVKEMGLDITTFGSLPKTMKEEYPSLVADYYRYNPVTNVVSAGDKHFKEDISIGDTNFINMYGFDVLYGNKQRPFTDNSSAVITEAMALKLFGEKNAINKVLSISTTHDGEKQDYKVSAVLKNLPYNSIMKLLNVTYSVYVPTIGNRYYSGGDPAEGWNSAYEVGMIELQPGKTPKDLIVPFRQVLKKYTPEKVQQNLTVELASVKDYYLNDRGGAARKMILILSLAALFILLMAVINFVNINIGTSSYRLKEIGLRKVFGGAKRQLIFQFITEALVLTFIATVLSLVAYELLRPLFGQVLNTTFQSLIHFNFKTISYLLLLILFTGFIAGIYPAFILSSSKLINAVKGKIDTAKGGLGLRKIMLTVQFTLAIMVFICTLTVSKQVRYVFKKDIGYEKEQLMVITAFPKQWDSVGISRMIDVRKGLQQLPAVKNATVSFEIPDRKPPSSIDMQLMNGDGKTVLITSCGADENYASTFGLKVLSGSCFAQSGAFVPNQIVLNESAAKVLGLTPQSAINRQVSIPSSPGTTLTISGVVKDFNYSSLQDHIEPIAFFHVKDAQAYRYLSVKINSPNIGEAINSIRNKWKELLPNSPFEYNFMDEKFQALYQSELQLKKATSIATILNLVIVFLGIFGVVTFTLMKRTKEIAVRKVLGADIKSIIILFSKDYAWLMLIANIIAWPVTYFLTSKWLEGFAYRIDQNIVPYLVVCVCIFVTAFALIAIQCFKASTANPVKSLRTE